jgi:pimeloyl-ACP methyl ester carboxylesterase
MRHGQRLRLRPSEEEIMGRILTALFAFAAVLIAGCQALPPGQPVAREMTVNGVTMKYVEQGRGEVVLLLPGAFSDLRAYDSSRDAIARSYRFVSPTLRYFGSDPWPDSGGSFSMATHLSDLAAFVRGLNAGPVHVVGWSYSSSLAVLLAVQHPDLVKSVFAYDQSFLVSWVSDPTELAAAGAARKAAFGPAVMASKGGDQAAAVRLIVDGANGKPGTFDALPAATRTMHLENARSVPLLLAAPPPPSISCAQLGQLKMPVAMGVGEYSPLHYEVPAKGASRCLPGLTLIVVPKESHHWPITSPAAFTERLLVFLKRQ